MSLRRVTDFILRGRLPALGTAFVLAWAPIIGSLSILIAAFVTLRKNAFEGALVFLAACLPLVARYFLAPIEIRTGLALSMIEIAVISNVLLWLFAVLLRKYSNWNFILEIGLLIGIIAVGLAHILYPEIQDGWASYLNTYFSKALASVESLKKDPNSLIELQAQLVNATKYYATGFLVAAVLLNAFLQLLIARWWEIIVFTPGRLRVELERITLSHVSGTLFVIMLVLAYFKNVVALDILPVMYVMFGLAGLSLIHYLLGLVTKGSWFWLVLVYVGMIWLFPFSMVAIAIIALFDTWLNIRKRIKT